MENENTPNTVDDTSEDSSLPLLHPITNGLVTIYKGTATLGVKALELVLKLSIANDVHGKLSPSLGGFPGKTSAFESDEPNEN